MQVCLLTNVLAPSGVKSEKTNTKLLILKMRELGLSNAQIATRLNACGIRTHTGKQQTTKLIWSVLKYSDERMDRKMTSITSISLKVQTKTLA